MSVQKALSIIDDSIKAVKTADKQDIKIHQDLELRQSVGNGKAYASQGNVTINILNQQVLVNLFELKEEIKNIQVLKLPNGAYGTPKHGLHMATRQYQIRLVKKHLELCGGSIQKTAAMLQVSRHTIYAILKAEDAIKDGQLKNVYTKPCVPKCEYALGERYGNSKLRHGEVWLINRLLSEGVIARSIAPMFGVSEPTISKIRGGRAWAIAKPQSEAD